MRMTGAQLSNAVATFIQQDMLPSADSGPLKLILGTASAAMRRDQSFLDRLLADNQGARMLLDFDGETYDPDLLIASLRDSVTGANGLTLTVPRIPLIMPDACKITLNRVDIDRLAEKMQ